MSNVRGTVKCDFSNAKDCIKECHYAIWPLDNGWMSFPDGRHCCPKCNCFIPQTSPKPLTVKKLFATICFLILTAVIVAYPVGVQWLLIHGPEWLVYHDPSIGMPVGLALSSVLAFFVLLVVWYVCLMES